MTPLLLVAVASAQQPITYPEALREALAHDPALLAARDAYTQAESSVMAAQSIFDPLLGADTRYTFPSRQTDYFQGFEYETQFTEWEVESSLSGSTGTGTGYSLSAGMGRNLGEIVTALAGADQRVQDVWRGNVNASISQELLKGHRFAYNVQNVTQARTARDIAASQVKAAEQKALADAADAYWNWVHQSLLAAIADDAVAVAEEGLRVGALQVEAKQLPEVERIRLEAALMKARSDALEARNAALAARDVLLLLMGQPPGVMLQPATEIGTIQAIDIDLEKAVEVAMVQNAELSIALAQADQAQLDHRLARHAQLPSLQGSLNMGYGPRYDAEAGEEEVLTGLIDSASPNWSLGGTFSVPIGNRAARAERDRTGSVETQRARELLELQRSVRSQVEEQVRTLTSSKQAVELADANLRLAEASLNAEEAKVRAGVTLHKDALEARQELATARGEAVRARTRYRLAQVELLRLQSNLTTELP